MWMYSQYITTVHLTQSYTYTRLVNNMMNQSDKLMRYDDPEIGGNRYQEMVGPY